MRDVVWEDVNDGKPNEVQTTVSGHRINVYSDKVGESWTYRVDDDPSILTYETKEEAQKEAIDEAKAS